MVALRPLSPFEPCNVRTPAMHILLIVTGGIAAYKTPELVRRLREQGAGVTCILTEAATHFVTPLSISAVSEQPVYQNLWDLKDEREMGHIRLSREADAILVAPASATFVSQLAQGQAADLATAAALASDKPLTIAPAMNHRMWLNPATQRNIALLKGDGHGILEPDVGTMACGEFGPGRMTEVPDLVTAIIGPRPLAGKTALVTSGPTVESLDPVRYLSNHSSGKQGQTIAAALVRAGAEVTLVSGPSDLTPPPGVQQVDVKSAQDMLQACETALPADMLICAAAVADYAPADVPSQKIKKSDKPLTLTLYPTPDILKTLCAHPGRPKLTIGFAAETGDLQTKASAKRTRKGCDWLLANDVGARPSIFCGDHNKILFLTSDGAEAWPLQPKAAVAEALVGKIVEHFAA